MARFNEHPKTTRPSWRRSQEDNLRQLAEDVDRIREGEVNWLGEFTVGPETTTTTVYDDRVRDGCHISLMPTNLMAAGLLPGLYFSTITEGGESFPNPVGRFVLTHAAPIVDADFRYCIKW